MPDQLMVMYEEEQRKIAGICERLCREAQAKAILLVDKNGQFIASHGDVAHLDTTSLASLTAGNIAATSGLAKLIGEKEFPHVFHEGERDNLHLSIVAQRAILVVMFDKRSTLGLVRLRLRRGTEELAAVFAELSAKAGAAAPGAGFGEITDDDIDRLFGE